MENGNAVSSNPEIMTPKEVSEYLKLPLSTVYKLSQEGKLQGTKFGKHWRYLKSDIESYLTGLNTMDSYGAAMDRRRFPRKVCDIDAVFEVDVPDIKKCKGQGIIRNISVGGALLEIGTIRIEGQFIMRGDPVVLTLGSFDPGAPDVDGPLHGTIVRFEQGDHTCIWVQFREASFEVADKVVTGLAG
jgi:excisionase family DNA binding protein